VVYSREEYEKKVEARRNVLDIAENENDVEEYKIFILNMKNLITEK